MQLRLSCWSASPPAALRTWLPASWRRTSSAGSAWSRRPVSSRNKPRLGQWS